MLFHAIKDIKKGEEITTMYSQPFRSFPSRDQSFRLNYGFTCECRLCQLDRNDAECEERERLVEMCKAVTVFEAGVNIDEVLATVTSLLNQVIVLIWLFRESESFMRLLHIIGYEVKLWTNKQREREKNEFNT